MREYVFGFIGPAKAFQMIKRGGEKVTRSSTYESKSIGKAKVEITVTANEGITEKPFQCQNRLGFFEAIVEGFNLSRPEIEHPECMFNGGSCCRYIVTWKESLSTRISSIRNCYLFISAFAILLGFFILPSGLLIESLVGAFSIGLLLSLAVEISKRQESSESVARLSDVSENLMDMITSNSRNIQLIHEMGEALSNKRTTEDVLYEVSQIMEKRLSFDCGAILLVSENKTRLAIRGAFGYSYDEISDLMKTSFHLDNPASTGPFTRAYHEKTAVVVSSADDMRGNLSKRSQKIVDDLSIESFIACPIIVADEVIGVLAVNNQASERPLLKMDVDLVKGVAPVIGVALQNVVLVEELHQSFEKTLQVLADSIAPATISRQGTVKSLPNMRQPLQKK